MQLHDLKRKTKNKKHREVGRGGKHAKTSGRGTKGQKARSGHRMRPELRDIIKKLPKMRGRGISIFQSLSPKNKVINLDILEKTFEDGALVSPSSLMKKGLLKKYKGEVPKVKILGTGTLSKKLSFTGLDVSTGAKAKIEKGGGSVK